jgi:hypothetical protein
MASSGMLRRVAPLRTDVSEELSSVRRLLVTAGIVPNSTILVTLMREALSSSETSVLTRRAIRRNIPEDAILHSHCRKKLKSYRPLEFWDFSTDWAQLCSPLPEDGDRIQSP